ncbi:MAG TPA: J domain-containing protein [Polyangia bacterium]|nr:J domain-containing protein [Polyangia bacterium]
MSIGRRLIDMARSELNSLLDVAARHSRDDDDDDEPAPHVGGSEEAEWHRRAQQEVEDAIHGRKTPEPPPRASSRPGTGTGKVPVADATRLQKAYAALEVPQGSDFETVRKAYRTLMRKYHPDHHTGSPEKQRAANEVAQRLTESYKLLEKKLRK